MLMIERKLFTEIKKKLFKGKAIIITGTRQTGKTTLLEWLEKETNQKSILLNCDEPDTRKSLTDVTSTQLKGLIGSHKIVLIDEAQRIRNIGLTLKLITDKIKDVQLIATGSSSLELNNEINEPLTGRKFEYTLFPVSMEEMVMHHGLKEEMRLLETRLVYGMYPDVINHAGEEKQILSHLTNSYLFKDIFAYKDVRKPDLLHKLLEALALQVSSEVSYNELANLLGVDTATIEKYITLLEQVFVVFRLRSFNRNLRSELKKSRKIYFYDNGIRNALISNYNSIKLRNDKGALWENYLVSERMKFNHYNNHLCNSFFWRTKDQQEIDYLEDYNGELHTYEFKWNSKGKPRIPLTFRNAYGDEFFKAINTENYSEFIGEA